LLVQRGEPPLLVCTTPEDYDETVFQQAEFGLSVGHRHKIPKRILDLFPQGIVNLHTGYLPWNRGAYPNVWPIIDGSPAGVTLHLMDEGIDTGPILRQVLVMDEVECTTTAYSLYQSLAKAAYEMFARWWGDGIPMHTRAQRQGSSHVKADLDQVVLDLNQLKYPRRCIAQAVLALLRARTFEGYPGLLVRDGDAEYRMTVRIEPI
jgi:methionyl-tRNA formyltransferase